MMSYRRIVSVVPGFLRRSMAPAPTCCVRFQSNNTSRPFDDIALQKIIETTNFGTEAKRDRELEQQRLETKRAKELRASSSEDKSSDEPSVDASLEVSKGFASTDLKKPIPQVSPETHTMIKDSIGELPSNREKQRSQMSLQLEAYLQSVQDTIFTASSALNDVTGYSGIERLKRTVDELEVELRGAKDSVKNAKARYSEAIQQRSTSQREVNELLTRKHNWSPDDLERFTTLYRNDHANEQHEAAAETALNDAESKVDAIQLKLTQSILTRYHEEQIWSDKIRKASTWGTWVLMGINVLLFITATFFVEPWKRKRLVGSFEDKVKQVLVEIEEGKATGKNVAQDSFRAPTHDTSADSKGVPASLSFKFYGIGWSDLKNAIKTNYNTLICKDVTTLKLDKIEFAAVTAVVGIVGATLGGLLMACFR